MCEKKLKISNNNRMQLKLVVVSNSNDTNVVWFTYFQRGSISGPTIKTALSSTCNRSMFIPFNSSTRISITLLDSIFWAENKQTKNLEKQQKL